MSQAPAILASMDRETAWAHQLQHPISDAEYLRRLGRTAFDPTDNSILAVRILLAAAVLEHSLRVALSEATSPIAEGIDHQVALLLLTFSEHESALKQQHFAELLGVSPPTAARIVQRARSKGWLRPGRDLWLSTSGRLALAELQRVLSGVAEEEFAGLIADSQRRHLFQHLDEFIPRKIVGRARRARLRETVPHRRADLAQAQRRRAAMTGRSNSVSSTVGLRI